MIIHNYVKNINDYVKIGDVIYVEILEVDELENTDIFDFMSKEYHDYDLSLTYDNTSKIVHTLSFIAKLLNANIDDLKGVWLTTHQNVLDKYYYTGIESGFNEIVKVFIHKNKMIPISDLGADGALFVYTGPLYSETILDDCNGKGDDNEMKKYTLELDLSEIVKLNAVCNAAIISEEETLRNLSNCNNEKIIDTTKNSIELIWNLKTKIKELLLNNIH